MNKEARSKGPKHFSQSFPRLPSLCPMGKRIEREGGREEKKGGNRTNERTSERASESDVVGDLDWLMAALSRLLLLPSHCCTGLYNEFNTGWSISFRRFCGEFQMLNLKHLEFNPSYMAKLLIKEHEDVFSVDTELKPMNCSPHTSGWANSTENSLLRAPKEKHRKLMGASLEPCQ